VSYAVRVLGRAQGDLLEIQRYIAAESPGSADELVEQLLQAIASLAEQPRRGACPRDERLSRLGYRFLVCGSYLVFYKVLRRQVRVYRVLHGRRAYSGIL